jgi:serine phosphatase RsbU (regulator of sigma subunit)
MKAEEITALFARRLEGFTLRNPAVLAADYADDAVLESPAFGALAGRPAIETAYHRWFEAFPDAGFQFGDLLITGDQVAQTATMYGTDTGGFLGQGPTGKRFRLFIVILFALDDRHITQERRVYDVTGLLMQLATDRGMAAETAQIYRATLEGVRLEHELTIAANVQRALLPEFQYVGAGFEVAGASEPCRAIGGDFFDYFELPGGTFGFALGDVAGKGPPAALLAARLQGILATQSYSELTSADVLTRANRVLVRRTVESRFATVFYGVLSGDGHVTYCNAGHNPPFLVGRSGMRRLETGGLILGAFSEAFFEEETVLLDPGDMLIVFSDGVTEAQDAAGTEFGDEGIVACVEANRGLPPAAFVECLLGTVAAFSSGSPPSDDRTVLVIRYTGSPES